MSEQIKTQIVRYNPEEHKDLFFTCGNPNIDSYLYRYCVGKDPESVMYLWMKDSKTILGFFALSCYSYNISEINSHTKEEKIIIHPAIQIKAFALSAFVQEKTFPGKDINYSDELFRRAMSTILTIASNFAGATFVYLSSVETAVSFYERQGFVKLDRAESIVSSECGDNDLVPMILKIDIT